MDSSRTMLVRPGKRRFTAVRMPVAVVLALAAGCSSKDGAQNGDGGGRGGPVPEAGGLSDDAAPRATSDDSGATDGSLVGNGVPDASPADAGDAGRPPDPCATARFCENFESYATGMAPTGNWKAETNLGAVSVVGDQHFDGQKSARFTTQSNSAGKTAYIKLAAPGVFPVPGNAYFGRMMTFLVSAPDQSVHWTFIQGGGLVPGQSYHALYRYGGQLPVSDGGAFFGSQLMANYDTPDSYNGTGPSSDCWNHAKGTVVPVGRWACVEWQFDGPNNAMHFWLDGTPIDSLTVAGQGQGCVHQPQTFTWTAPDFSTLELGWESYQNDTDRTLYLDDVVIATDRVGCPPGP
jgi:hypothetical protein